MHLGSSKAYGTFTGESEDGDVVDMYCSSGTYKLPWENQELQIETNSIDKRNARAAEEIDIDELCSGGQRRRR